MHTNKSIPPVEIKLLVKMGDDTWLPCIRRTWVTNKDNNLEFVLEGGLGLLTIKRSRIEWIYP